MIDPPPPHGNLLKALPDDPLHVEVRGLLMCRSDVSLLPDPAAPTTNGFLFAPLHGLAVGYGVPPVSMLDDVRALANRFGMTGQDVELNLPLGAAPQWLDHSRVTGLGEHRVQTFTEPAAFERVLDLVAHDAALNTDPSDPRLKTLPVALQAEFGSLCPWPVVVAIMARGQVASIAYAFVETEGYFDISIDTPHLFRREGYGVSCAAALIRHQIHRGKNPVWIARENNAASLASGDGRLWVLPFGQEPKRSLLDHEHVVRQGVHQDLSRVLERSVRVLTRKGGYGLQGL